MTDLSEYPVVGKVEDVCVVLKVSAPTVRELIRTKQIASFRCGRAIRVSRQAVERFIASQEAPQHTDDN